MILSEKDSALASEIIVSPNFTSSGTYDRRAKWVILHTMETSEVPNVARNIGYWFANPAAQAAAQYCVDAKEVIQCVNECDFAWAAGPTGNYGGVQIEMAGRAAQSSGEWFDAYSLRLLELTAALTADICRRHGIPMKWLNDAQLAAGVPGVTTHAALARVFGETDHTDPGANFPVAHFMSRVLAHAEGRGGEPTVPPKTVEGVPRAGGASARVAMKGVFRPDRRLEVSADVDPNSPAVAAYEAGQAFNYDSWCIANGYVWLSYWSGKAGARRFVAIGPDDGRTDTTWGKGFYN